MAFNSSFPLTPIVPLQYLTSQPFPVGARIKTYITDVIKTPISDSFSDNCAMLDNLRDQLLDPKGLSLDSIPLFVDYATLLLKLSKGLDLSDKGVGAVYNWNQKIRIDPEFDLCCISFNLALLLANNCNNLPLKTVANLKPTMGFISAGLGVIDKCLEYHKNDYDEVITEEMIKNLRHYLELFYTMWQSAGILIKNGKPDLIAKLTNQCSSYCSLVSPPNKDLQEIFQIYAHYYYAQYLYAESECGRAISILRECSAAIPDQKALKKASPDKQQQFQGFRNFVDQLLSKYTHDNEVIFSFQSVPSPAEKIPTLPKKPIEGKLNWAPTVTVTSLEDSLSESIVNKADQRIQNYVSSSEKALSDINDLLGSMPLATMDEVNSLHTQVANDRNRATEVANQTSQLIGMKAQQVTQRFPQAFQKFNDYSKGIEQARQSDIFFDTKLAQANNEIAPIVSSRDKLMEFMDKITKLVQKAREAGEKAKNRVKEEDPSQLTQINTDMNAEFTALAQELQPVFIELDKTVKEVRELIGTKVPNYLGQIQIVQNGLKQGQAYYQKLLPNMQALYQQVLNT